MKSKLHAQVRKVNKYMINRNMPGQLGSNGKPFDITVKAVKKMVKRNYQQTKLRLNEENKDGDK